MSLRTMKGKKKGKPPMPPQYGGGSESDQSGDTNSISADSQELGRSPNNQPKVKKDEWEILEGLKEGQRFEFVPNKFEGYLSKRRKWPLKGWHKRYFILDKAILIYAKNPAELAKGKKHGTVDIAMSVVSTKARRRRIDIDADSSILHVKCKSRENYLQWVEQLKQHRLHKQHKLLYMKPRLSPVSPEESPTDVLLSSGIIQGKQSLPNSLPNTLTRDAKQCITPGISRGSLAGAGSFRGWLMDIVSLDNIGKTINTLQDHVDKLTLSIKALDGSSEEPVTPSAKKRGGKFRLRKHKSKSSSSTSDIYPDKIIPKAESNDIKAPNTLQIEGNLVDLRPLSTSNPALSPQSSHVGTTRPYSCSDTAAANLTNQAPIAQSNHPLVETQMPAISLDDSSVPANARADAFITKAYYVVNQMNCVLRSLQAEKDRARRALEAESSVVSHNPSAVIASLRVSLNQAVQQNAELRGRLTRIHEDSNITDICSPPTTFEAVNKSLRNSLSYESSSCFSVSEYFDAQDDKAGSDTSSEVSSDNSSVTSDASETGTDAMPSVADSEEVIAENDEGKCFTGRRTCLPVPQPTSQDFSLFSLLYKNIGKDLSKLSMPVSLNEPLNMLQRLSEELEYSELLDKAVGIEDASERMIQVAAFAVSAYASSIHRAAHKPFNPLLGETYESIREDKGFRFIAEQVSHHPPISVSHAQSHNYVFCQDLRIKTKFWGKSLEFQPSGKATLYFPKWDELYEWNKVTTCVHNLFGSGTRWVDQYGEMVIRNNKAGLMCKLSFVKANSNSSKRHEVFGTIQDLSGQVVHNLFGKWSEALYCGHAPSARVVWRPGAMPDGYELYYGFTRFAIELNELDHDSAKLLPPTDSRFRPDQRYLEEGKLNEAEELKQYLEQQQRERKKMRESDGVPFIPMWFRTSTDPSTEGNWVFGGEYWNKRKDPGFINMSFDAIW